MSMRLGVAIRQSSDLAVNDAPKTPPWSPTHGGVFLRPLSAPKKILSSMLALSDAARREPFVASRLLWRSACPQPVWLVDRVWETLPTAAGADDGNMRNRQGASLHE